MEGVTSQGTQVAPGTGNECMVLRRDDCHHSLTGSGRWRIVKGHSWHTGDCVVGFG